MLSLATGHDVGYLTGPVAGGREGYYTGAVAAGEPAGLWYGAGAEVLGLTGQVDAELMEAVYTHLLDPRDPATGSRSTWGTAEALAAPHRRYRSADEIYAGLLESQPDAEPEERAAMRARAEKSARQAVSFIDATFSAPKSVTVLGVAFERAENDARAAGDERAAEAWATHRRAVEDAVMDGARASVDYLAKVAGYSRVGHHGGGAGRWIDAHEWVVAQFLQHDSRDRDPQLHVHQAILNRVPCADGTWRTLDGRAIHDHRGAAGAVGERVMEASLTRALGVRFATRPDGKAREILGVDQAVIDLFSSRRRAVTAKTDELVRAFATQLGRDPSNLERTRLAQQATLATRAAKAHAGETLAERLDRWEAETRREVAGGLASVAHAVLDVAQDAGPAQRWSPDDVVERALASVAEKRQSWSRSDLTRAISDALPGHLGLSPDGVQALLDQLTDVAAERAVRLNADEPTADLPDELLLADGRSAYARPGAARFTTTGQVAAERILRRAAVERGAAALSAEEADAVIGKFAESGHELGYDQAAAVRGVLSSRASVEVLSAAAGTGKSFTVGAIAEAWTAAGRRVIGLAPSQVAAEVLSAEGLDSMNIARWRHSDRRLEPGDLVVIDEAGMTSTTDLAELHRETSAAGAKLLLVGDPRQLGAVGPGGALAEIGERGLRYELTEVRRFSAGWERTASLRLRDGDPQALNDYQRRGRIVDGGAREQTEAAASRAWLADTLAGCESVLLVDSNEAAARLSAALRAELVALGRVDEQGTSLDAQGTYAGPGDLIQARRNGWELIGYDGNTRAPINRETYRVVGALPDGGLRVTDAAGTPMSLPRKYVATNVTLGYASTVHSAQGRTVDTSHAVVAPGSDAASVYVALTRGRDTNTVYVVTAAVPADAHTGEVAAAQRRTGQAVLAEIIEQAEQDRFALAQHEQADREYRSVMRHVDRLADGIAEATAGRTGQLLDQLTADGALTSEQRMALAADDATPGLGQLLRTAELAGHDPADVLRSAVELQTLDGARSAAQVIHHRIRTSLAGQLAPEIASCSDLLPRDIPEHWRPLLQHHADAADDRRRELGASTAEAAPQWAVEALGSVPEDALARAEWEHRAGWAAAYRELVEHEDQRDPLGPPPPAGLGEKAALWRAAHTALDLPDVGAEEAECSVGQLRVRVEALAREQEWAPEYVAEELADAHQELHRLRADAEVWAARADTTDGVDRDQLRTAADEAERTAGLLAERIDDLEVVDDARASWYAHTAVTRDKAERARAELATRGVDLDSPADRVTAQEWLAAHRADEAADEAHREIGEDDLAEDRDDAPEARGAQSERQPTEDTREAVQRAQEALAKIEERRVADEQHDAEDTAEHARGQELARWAEDEHAAEAGDVAVLER